ncbi:YfhE family protein [Alteribacter populi]|nr:YfhE family protein [Alteribacter populi]
MESKKRQAKEERSKLKKPQEMAYMSDFKAADRAALRSKNGR